MTNAEPDALWEQALQEQEDAENRLVSEIVELTWDWANGDWEQLNEAVRILAKTKYLGENQ